MEPRTGRQESMEPISKNRKVCRKSPNYAESRKVIRKRSRFVRRGEVGKGSSYDTTWADARQV